MSGHTLEDEAQAHMALARLLRKDRPPEVRDAVQKILDSDISTGTKIARIRKLDGTDEPQDESASPVGDSVEELKASAQMWQPLKFTLGKLKNIIKLPHTSVSFFAFFFGERRKIKEFGKKTHVFSPTFLLPLVRLDKAIPTFLSGSLQVWAARLVDLLEPAIENGWQILTKRDYNMIIALRKLCDEIVSVNFRIFNYRDRYLIDKIRNIEALFFVFQYKYDYSERTVENVSRALLADGEHDEEAEEVEILVKSILFQGFSLPSLYDLLLGLNMMKFRQVFTYADLVAKDLGEIFNTAHFSCTMQLKERIDGSVENLRQSILKIEDRRNHIRRVRKYVLLKESGAHDDSQLEALYEFEESRSEGVYRRDRENVIHFVPQLLRKLDAAFSPLLIGRVRLEKTGPVAVFDSQLFLQPVDHFRRVGFKLEQLSFGYRIFSYDRYLGMRKEGKPSIAVEAEIVRLLQEVLSDFSNLGNKLALMLERMVDNPPIEPARKPINEHDLQKGALMLPFGDEIIVSKGYLRGRTVRQALQILVSLSFLLNGYLYDRDLAELKETEVELEKKVTSQLHSFERMADEAAYREVVTQVIGQDTLASQPVTLPPDAAGPGAPLQ